MYRQAGGTIPPSPAVPPPFTQGRLIADAQCASLHGVRPYPLPFRQTGVGTAIGRPRADVVIGPYGGPTEGIGFPEHTHRALREAVTGGD